MNHKPSASRQVIQAIAVTAELMGTDLSEAAARVFACELSGFPEAQVIEALTRCRREVRGRLTLADVLSRIDDGRPGVEEAWALVPRCEDRSVVWTTEMAEAAGPAFRLLNEGDPVGARMAFKERYTAVVQKARAAGEDVRWYLSCGYDHGQRESIVAEAVRQGRLSYDYAKQRCRELMMPEYEPVGIVAEAVRQGRLSYDYAKQRCPELMMPEYEHPAAAIAQT